MFTGQMLFKSVILFSFVINNKIIHGNAMYCIRYYHVLYWTGVRRPGIYFYKDGGSAVIEFTPQVLKIYIASAKIYITSAKNLQHEREARVL